MKTFFICLLTLFCTSVTTAQKIPSFGKIDKADLLYKECSYDKDAAAEYLIDYGEVNYFFTNSDFFNETKFRVRIKILKEKGVELANVRIPYYWKSNRQSVGNIDGYTFNLDEKGEVVETKMEKKSVMTQKLNENVDMEVFTLPNVKVGSVIEYHYNISKKNYIELDDWVFQREYPVRYSEYNTAIPDGLVFTYQVKRTLPVKETTEGRNVKRFIMTNIPGLDKEPYMSCAKDYYQRVDFQLSSILNRPVNSTWVQITEELLNEESFGDQLKKNILKNLPLATELKNLTTDKAKIQAVYSYVKKTVTWNGKNSIWCRDGVKAALEKNMGNSAEINLLVINLLRDAGITAYPILVSTRPNGKINTLYPFIYQFDNVYIYTEANGKAFILDATNPYNPDFMVPWDVQFTDGFLVDIKNGQFISLSDTKHRFKINTFLQAEIDEQGMMKGSANVLAYEYAKNQRLSTLNKGKEKYVTDYFKEPHPDFKIDSVALKNEKVDSLPLENMVTFQTQLNNSAEYYFVTPNLFTELEKNEFISDQRFTDIEFGYVQYYNIFGTIRFPNSMEPEELPKNIKMILPDTSIIMQRFMEKNENSISFRITLEIKRPTYYAEEYPDFKAFYSVLFDKLNEQIVFKKKANPKP
jgi:Domain of Unknown Function with PDB structure (DUF3857)/Transglutaminase-like superfamily